MADQELGLIAGSDFLDLRHVLGVAGDGLILLRQSAP